MKGSKIRETNLMKLQMSAMMMEVLPDFRCSSSQNLESCRYLLPREEIYIPSLRPSLSSTPLSSSMYLEYFS